MALRSRLPFVLGALFLTSALSGTTLANDGPGAQPLVDPDPNASAGTPALEGTEWLLAKAQLSGAYADIPKEVEATLLMQDGRAGGSGGCNQWSTTYVLDGASLTFGDQIVTTLMLCEGPGGDIETFYLADLPGVTDWAIDGTTLTLSNETGPVLAFVPRADSALRLEGDWVVTAYNDGQGTLVTVDDGSVQVSIADGTLTGTAGCNRLSGAVSQTGDAVTIGPIMSTKMFCEGLMEQETAVIASLEATTQVRQEADVLTFLDAAGTTQLRLVPVGATTSPSASPVPSPLG